MIKAATIPMHMQMEGRSWVGEKKKKNEVLLKEQTMHEIDVSTLAKKKKKNQNENTNISPYGCIKIIPEYLHVVLISSLLDLGFQKALSL